MTRVIDLNGPQGNAISLVGIAKDLAGQLDQKVGFHEIEKQMLSSNYSNLISVFEENYSDYVKLINKPDEEAEDE
jgi:hypothetical protein